MSNIIKKIENARTDYRQSNNGKLPNVIILGYETLRDLFNEPEILNYIDLSRDMKGCNKFMGIRVFESNNKHEISVF